MSHDGDMHGDDDPFLGPEGAAFAVAWTPILETGTATLSEALLDAARVVQGTRVLDLACGMGYTTLAAARRGAHATGLDLNPHTLAQAVQGAGVQYAEGDMLAPPPGPWDAIVNRFGAHHADPAWLAAAVRVLAPGGWIAIAEWSPDTALFQTGDDGSDHGGPAEETAEDWAARFEAAGLTDIRTSEVAFTLDFGDEATFQRFIEAMPAGHEDHPGHAVAGRAGAPGGKQLNRAFVVAGRR